MSARSKFTVMIEVSTTLDEPTFLSIIDEACEQFDKVVEAWDSEVTLSSRLVKEGSRRVRPKERSRRRPRR